MLAGNENKNVQQSSVDAAADASSKAANPSAVTMPEQSNDYRVAVFGAGGVGKSSLVQRFVRGTFSDNYVPTIEDTYRQVIHCNRQQNVCTLQITDTTGSHQFPAMQRLSISKGHAFLLVYSITSKQSLQELVPIFETIKEVKGAEVDEIPVMLVGNKTDESSVREVKKELGEALAKKWGVGFIETSAKADNNVRELFQQLLALEKRRSLSLDPDDGADGSGKKKKKKGGKDDKKDKGKSGGKDKGAKDSGTATKSKCSIM